MITPERTFFDYGCGHGDDLAALREDGIECDGFDPAFRPNVVPRVSDVVNMGYVLNVIEDLGERQLSLQNAWAIAKRVLCVASRVVMGESSGHEIEYGDGHVTSIGTFQKYYSQTELRDYIQETLGADALPAAPGVFYVFRDQTLKSQFLSERVRRSIPAPRKRIAEVHFEQAKHLLEPLIESILVLGRLPEPDEFDLADQIVESCGSLKRAFTLIKKVTGEEDWESIHSARTDDLLVYLALSNFGRRAKFSQLSTRMKRDVKSFFGTYKLACEQADALLFLAGNSDAINEACLNSKVGRLTSNALWLHKEAVPSLVPLLRVYEGCARAYIGAVDDMNIVKLHRYSGKLSYMSCDSFDEDAHPPLTATVKVALRTLRLDYYEYAAAQNPLLLDLKESMVPTDYPLRSKFQRLSKQELKHGLLSSDMDLRSRQQWQSTLEFLGFTHRGHRLIRKRA